MNGDPGALLHDLLLGMGRIQGSLERIQETQQTHTDQLNRLDSRVDGLEGSVKVHSVVGGGLVAAAVAVGIDLVKAKLFGTS